MEETKTRNIEYPAAGDQDQVAASAAEFKKKYGKKRFTAKSAPKAVMYSFLYECYQQNEGKIRESLYPDIRQIQSLVRTVDDMNRWNNYIGLMEWYQNSFNTAVFMRNALQTTLSDLDNITKSLIAGENLRREITGNQPQTVWLWLSSLTIEAYTPQAHGSVITGLRRNAEEALRYVNAYNSFVRLIAEVVGIPECTIFEVRMSKIWELMDSLNEALIMLREDVAEHRAKELETEAEESETRDLTLWSPEYLEATMEAFQPIGKDQEAVPEEKEERAKARIIRDFGKASLSWYSIFREYSTEYWRRPNA